MKKGAKIENAFPEIVLVHLKNFVHTLKCLSIGTPKIINFPFVSNGKLMVFRSPNIQAHYNEAVLCLKFGTPENLSFLGVPGILKHIRVLKGIATL